MLWIKNNPEQADIEYARACTELLVILNNMSIKDYNKIDRIVKAKLKKEIKNVKTNRKS